MQAAFEAHHIHKNFGETKALDGVTLKAEEGKIFALLGPNGAGKTTLVRLLSTLIAPDKGSAKVLGVDVAEHPDEVRRLIGLAGQFAAVDEFQTGRENLYMVGRLYHLSHKEAKARAEDILDRFHLTKAANRPVRTYSGGMRRRLDVGACLVGRPKVLFLDEPTTGLDPRTRVDLWNITRELTKQGASILLTTQYLEEADELANRIAVMDEGKIIAEGTSDQLKARLGGDVVEFEIADAKQQAAALAAITKLAKRKPTVDDNGVRITVPVQDDSKSLLKAVAELNRAKVEVDSISLHRPSLDDVFLALTGKKTRPEVVRPKSNTGMHP